MIAGKFLISHSRSQGFAHRRDECGTAALVKLRSFQAKQIYSTQIETGEESFAQELN
jgi:hypothetical protein